MIFNDLLTAESLAEEYLEWCKNYVRLRVGSANQPYSNRNHDDLRFGQYICNKYLVLGKSAPEIYYAENVGDAYWLIVDVLINQES